MVRHTGFEPVATRLKVVCSTSWANDASLERETRVELATFSLEGWRSTNWAIPAYIIKFLVAGARFELTTFGLWARRATRLLYPATLWCLEPESNRHGTKYHGILSPVRLPVPPSRQSSTSFDNSHDLSLSVEDIYYIIITNKLCQ